MKMKNMIFAIIALLLLTSLVITGCKKTEVPETPYEEETEETTTDDMSELDNLDKELDMSELEGIEKDLEGIDW